MSDRSVIRSIRKGTAQWNEEDRLALCGLLVKAGYTVRINRLVTGNGKAKPKTEYVVEYWEEDEGA